MSETTEHFPSEAQIAQRAYKLWELRGRRLGNPEVDWYAARAELIAEHAAAEAATTAQASPVIPLRQTREVPPRPRDISRWASEPRSYRRGAYAAFAGR